MAKKFFKEAAQKGYGKKHGRKRNARLLSKARRKDDKKIKKEEAKMQVS